MMQRLLNVVVNGDIHQQNADRVGCSRKEVKNRFATPSYVWKRRPEA